MTGDGQDESDRSDHDDKGHSIDSAAEVASPAGPIRVVYADDALLAVDKPCGLLSVPGIGPDKADCLVARLQAAYPGTRIVHRLDRDTSGIMVLARNAEVHRHLSVQFQDRHVRKAYVAFVAGVLDVEGGEINEPIRKDLDHPPRQMIDHVHGRPSLTRFTVTARGSDRSRVELRPVTGRSHQLRLHLAHIGHPILGDDLYAPPEILALADRLQLHATMLEVTHPVSGSPLLLTAPAPF